MKEIINQTRREMSSFTLSSQSITDLINRMQELQNESSPIVQIICDDDYQVLKLARMFIIKLNDSQPMRNHIQITGGDWREENIDFALIMFWMDDLEINRIIAYKFLGLGGNAGFDVVRQRDFLRFIYDEVENVINNLRLGERQELEELEARVDISSQIQERREREIQNALLKFKQYVERDGWKSFWKNGVVRSDNIKNCSEEIAKGQLMAFLKGHELTFEVRHNTFQEVQEGAGFCDVIHLDNLGNMYIFELKMWRGQSYFDSGITQLDDYLLHEGINEGYYIVFDTRIRDKIQITSPINRENGNIIHIIQIDIAQIAPTSQ